MAFEHQVSMDVDFVTRVSWLGNDLRAYVFRLGEMIERLTVQGEAEKLEYMRGVFAGRVEAYALAREQLRRMVGAFEKQ